MKNLRLLRITATACIVACMAPASGALAGGTPPNSAVVVSAPSTIGHCPGRPEHVGSEHDLSLAVHPSDPRTLAAVWTQDDGNGTVAATSFDGGRTWRTVVVPGMTTCTGGQDPITFDPGVSIGPDGVVYVSSPTWSGDTDPLEWGMRASVSRDGGATFERAIELDRRTGIAIDWPTVTADPYMPGRAYIVWTGINIVPGDSLTYMSQTVDGGGHWSPPFVIGTPDTARVNFLSRLHVLPDGGIGHVWIDFPAQPGAALGVWNEGTTRILSARSIDGGLTWSSPITVAEVPPSTLRDPDTGQAKTLFFPTVMSAMASDGSVHVCWTVRDQGTVFVASSYDMARTWGPAELVADVAAPALLCSVAAMPGSRAVSWYDFRHDVAGDEQFTIGAQLAQSSAGAWRETTLGGTFDFGESEPSNGSGHPHGDAFGLVAVGQGYGALFTLLAPHAEDGLSDVFFQTAR